MSTRLRLVAAVAALTFVSGLVACSSDVVGPESFDAKAAARTLRAGGGVEIRGSSAYGKERGPIVGRIGYRPYRLRSRLTIPTGQFLAEATLVRIGDDAWVRRSVITKLDRAIPIGPATFMLRTAAEPAFVELKSSEQGFGAYLAVPYDPAKLLDRIAATGAEFASDGSSAVGGTERKRFRTTLKVMDARRIGVANLTVWVDAQGRPVRFAFKTAIQGSSRYDITKLQGELTVSPPPAAQVELINQPLPDATGPYTTVLETTAGTTAVRILTAPADRGWTCWKVESEPPFVGITEPRPSGGSCAATPTLSATVDDEFAIPLDATAETPYELLGLHVAPGSTVEFSRIGAEPVTVTAGPSGLAAYVGPAEPVVALAKVTTADNVLICGPVGIDNIVDFTAATTKPKSAGSLRGAPWNCLPEELANALSE